MLAYLQPASSTLLTEVWMPRIAQWRFVLFAALFIGITGSAQDEPIRLERLFEAASVDETLARAALIDIASNWHNVDPAMLIEMVATMRVKSPTASAIPQRLLTFLGQQTGQSFGEDPARWRDWIRASPARSSSQNYARFKRALYAQVEPLAQMFFAPGAGAAVRLDEIVWSGTTVGNSRTLNYPGAVAGVDATYMNATDTVFGVAFARDQARAYPMNMLERFPVIRDRFNGRDVTIVHSRWSGSTVAFESDINGRKFTLGDSAFVYRSSTVLFDDGTKSLWSMVTGQPLLGELVGSGLSLHSIAATTVASWKEWRSMNPATTVSTGQTPINAERLGEATPRDVALTQGAQVSDPRSTEPLSPNAEVLGLQLVDRISGEPVRLAIDLDFLRMHPLYTFSKSTQQVVDPYRIGYSRVQPAEASVSDMIVITSPEGANRVYQMVGFRSFPAQPFGPTFVDDRGLVWRMAEEELTTPIHLLRRPALRVLWLAWHDYFPDSLIIR
jgi:hypothetical protein